MKPIERFQDAVIELEQYRAYTDTPRHLTAYQPDCAEVITRMESLVSDEPEIVDFYRNAMLRYRKRSPENVAEEIGVIQDRIITLRDLDVLSPAQAARQQEELHEGHPVYKEAKTFFRMFRGVIDASLIPKDRYRQRKRSKQKIGTDKTVIPGVVGPEVVQPTVSPEVSPTKIDLPKRAKTSEDPEVVHIDPSDTHDVKGWEYDELVMAYRDHPRNNPSERYERDFNGFARKRARRPFPGVSHFATGETSDAFATSRTGLLLDGLVHETTLKEKIDRGKDAYFKLQEAEVISDEEKNVLENDAIDGCGAYLTMFECNIHLVWQKAKVYAVPPNYSETDAFQDGCLGLRRAIQKFDPSKGFKFSTYAIRWIRQQVARNRLPILYDIAVPAGADQHCREIKKYISDQKDGMQVSDANLLELGYTEAEIRAARYLLKRERKSLDSPLKTDSNFSLLDTLSAPDVDFESGIVEDEHIAILKNIIGSNLAKDKRALMILALRHGVVAPGLDYDQPVTINGFGEAPLGQFVLRVRRGEIKLNLDDIAPLASVTRERIRQIQAETEIQLLRGAAVQEIARRLLLSDDELRDMRLYFELHSFHGPGKQGADKKTDTQQRAAKVVEMLQLLDEDLEEICDETISSLAPGREEEDGTIALREWLSIRFGIRECKELPVSKSKVEISGTRLESAVVLRAESEFLARLAGVYGKVPTRIIVAA